MRHIQSDRMNTVILLRRTKCYGAKNVQAQADKMQDFVAETLGFIYNHKAYNVKYTSQDYIKKV